MSAERISALRNAAATRSLDAEKRAREALVALDEQGEQITFRAVAARANVSRQFLYSHRALRAEVDRLRRAAARAVVGAGAGAGKRGLPPRASARHT